jgi:8-oxo-dGTP pyrophosphatase MutT (NUDIX family)
MDSFIHNLQEKLNTPLPGKKAQQMLSPETRNAYKSGTNRIEAAILILIYQNAIDKDLMTVFIKRPKYNGHHSGQVSFPGGKYEESDISIEQTALRESQEEIGINVDSVNILGKLTNLYIPVSNFMVHPFVGYTKEIPKFVIDKNEVDYMVYSSIDQLINLKIEFTKKEFNQTQYNIPYFNINGETVWGATAMILNEFIEILKST